MDILKKLAELLDDACWKLDLIEAEMVAEELVAKGVTVQQWRPVSELPKRNGETVLVYFEYFRYGEYNRLFRSIGLGYALDGQWTRFINGESGWHKLKILAWMPLPQPPKGE